MSLTSEPNAAGESALPLSPLGGAMQDLAAQSPITEPLAALPAFDWADDSADDFEGQYQVHVDRARGAWLLAQAREQIGTDSPSDTPPVPPENPGRPPLIQPSPAEGRGIVRTVLDNAGEIPTQTIGGISSAVRQFAIGLDALGDWFNQNVVDLTLPDTGIDLVDRFLERAAGTGQEVPAPETATGQAMRTIAQFLTGFVPVFRAARAREVPEAIGRVVAPVAAAIAGARGGAARGAAVGEAVGRAVGESLTAAGAGAAADALVRSGHDERLARLLNEVPLLRGPVTEYLAGDLDDSELEGRFKNAIEGFGLGLAGDGLFQAVRAIARARRTAIEEIRAGGPAGEPPAPQTRRGAEASTADQSVASDAGRPAATSSSGVASGERNTLSTLAPSAERQDAAARSQYSALYNPSGNFANRQIAPSQLRGRSISDRSEELVIEASSGRRVYHAYNDVGTLRGLANAGSADLEATLRSVAEIPGAQFVRARVKDLSEIESKIRIGRAPREIGDYLGGRIIADTPQALEELVQRLQATGRVLAVDNTLATPNPVGYRAIHVQIAGDNGLSAEVQLLPREIAAAQDRVHGLYRQYRRRDLVDDEVAAERAARQAEREAFEAAWRAWLERTGAGRSDPGVSSALLVPGATILRAVGQESIPSDDTAGSSAGGADDAEARTDNDSRTGAQVRGALPSRPSHLLTTLPAQAAAAERAGLAPWRQGRSEPSANEASALVYGAVSALQDLVRQAAASEGGPRLDRPSGEVGIDLERAGTLGAIVDFIDHARAGGAPRDGANSLAQFNYRATLHAEAYRRGVGEGLSGEALAARVAAIVANPPAHIRLRAAGQSETRALLDTSSDYVRRLVRLRNARGADDSQPFEPLLLTLPLLAQPEQMLDYGLRPPLSLYASRLRDDLSAGGARGELARAQLGVGGAIMLLAGNATAEGRITGAAATDGAPAHSLRIGGQWQRYDPHGPVGRVLGFAADLQAGAARGEIEPEDLEDWRGLLASGALAATQLTRQRRSFQAMMRMLALLSGRAGAPEQPGQSPFARTIAPPGQDADPLLRANRQLAELSGRLLARRTLWGDTQASAQPIDAELAALDHAPQRIRLQTWLAGVTVDLRPHPQVYKEYARRAGNELPIPAFGGLGLRDYLNAAVTGQGGNEISRRAHMRYTALSDESERVQFIENAITRARAAAGQSILADPRFAEFRRYWDAQRLRQAQPARRVVGAR
jgi:hypothetical protein